MMQDTLGRTIDYLRLSVTDLCNYRCQYCMGCEGVPKRSHQDILSIEELAQIGEAAIRCGVKKIRLTGGEPLVRRGILELCRQLRKIEGLKELTMTTNGAALPQMAAQLKDAGVDRLNVSLDTLRPERFRAITRCGELDDVLRGLQAAEKAGFTDTKLNVVLLGGINDDEIADFAALTGERPYCVRFIELMPMGVCADWPQERFLSADAVLQAVPELEFAGQSGVSEVYRLPNGKGSVGLIRPMSHTFCGLCNRIRVTADGKLKPCLHSLDEYDLRGLQGKALEAAIRRAVEKKPLEHHLLKQHRSDTERQMHEIGG